MSRLQPETPYVYLALGIVLAAAGMALLMPPSTEAIVSSLPQSKAGVGSAVNDTTREVGGAIGIALLGSLLSIGYRSGVSSLVDNPALPRQAAEAINDSVAGASFAAAEAPAPFGAQILANRRERLHRWHVARVHGRSRDRGRHRDRRQSDIPARTPVAR